MNHANLQARVGTDRKSFLIRRAFRNFSSFFALPQCNWPFSKCVCLFVFSFPLLFDNHDICKECERRTHHFKISQFINGKKIRKGLLCSLIR